MAKKIDRRTLLMELEELWTKLLAKEQEHGDVPAAMAHYKGRPTTELLAERNDLVKRVYKRRLTKPTKPVLKRVVKVLSLLKHVTRKAVQVGVGLNLQAIADAMSSDELREWLAVAEEQLKSIEARRRRKS